MKLAGDGRRRHGPDVVLPGGAVRPLWDWCFFMGISPDLTIKNRDFHHIYG